MHVCPSSALASAHIHPFCPLSFRSSCRPSPYPSYPSRDPPHFASHPISSPFLPPPSHRYHSPSYTHVCAHTPTFCSHTDTHPSHPHPLFPFPRRALPPAFLSYLPTRCAGHSVSARIYPPPRAYTHSSSSPLPGAPAFPSPYRLPPFAHVPFLAVPSHPHAHPPPALRTAPSLGPFPYPSHHPMSTSISSLHLPPPALRRRTGSARRD
ncbi:hypothetical protein FB451DRAFT_1305708, partial [Mycena latifolia]